MNAISIFRKTAVRASAVAVLILLSACATQMVWVHPDRPGERVDQDLLFCETVARSEVSRPQAPPPTVNLTGLASVIRMMDQAGIDREHEAEITRHATECLRKKGWRLSGER